MSKTNNHKIAQDIIRRIAWETTHPKQKISFYTTEIIEMLNENIHIDAIKNHIVRRLNDGKVKEVR